MGFTHDSATQGVDLQYRSLPLSPSTPLARPPRLSFQQAIQNLSPLPLARYHARSRPPRRVIVFPLGKSTTKSYTQLVQAGESDNDITTDRHRRSSTSVVQRSYLRHVLEYRRRQGSTTESISNFPAAAFECKLLYQHASDRDEGRFDQDQVVVLSADRSLIWRCGNFKDGGQTQDLLPEGRSIDSVDIKTKTVHHKT